MLPQEISEYKQKWMKNPYSIAFHSDKISEVKEWCKKNLKQQQWKLSKYTNVYEHTIFFEKEESLILFKKYIT